MNRICLRLLTGDASAPNNAYLDLVGELTAFVNV